jgi:hypothetical protein
LRPVDPMSALLPKADIQQRDMSAKCQKRTSSNVA